ncbi:hypothetical protein [Streptomyces spinoverrucosus]|uniref:hypothetical protein n=1 Tax=Streptomyces spinoverrucosus TaxID=284043 RepID=UPI0011413785|nr:hypothetical protein [Streptomyces spinoverrucosus]
MKIVTAIRRCGDSASPARSRCGPTSTGGSTPIGTDSGLPAAVPLQPRGHHDLADLPAERPAEPGPMLCGRSGPCAR